MSAKIVNLRRTRKAKARADKSKHADTNRALHGISKAERDKAEAKRLIEVDRIDRHRRDRSDGSDNGQG